MTPVLLLRCDATVRMGSGHVMRCLALAQAWQDAGGTALFVSASVPPALQQRLKREGCEVELLNVVQGSMDDARATGKRARERQVSWMVVDGYHFDADYQRTLKDAEARLLVLDDNAHAAHYVADVVLNQNVHAAETMYPRRETYTRLLLGTRYALLRREFWKYRGWRREIQPIARRILVTMGGTDPENVTLRVLQALDRVDIPGLEVDVILGGANPHRRSLEDAARVSHQVVRVTCDVEDMPERMVAADMAISAAGSTCWELALLQLPPALVIVAPNQARIATALHSCGAALSLGMHEHLVPDSLSSQLAGLSADAAMRCSMAVNMCELVDGFGGRRVADLIEDGTCES
jgi:UDP-2,4-diacetamido-2,4,6-trideoxy-beta-L-altropyranose hydrolase